jgi:succinate dehydrogenase/fumarate reductase cytochrome b subunit (b558 family)
MERTPWQKLFSLSGVAPLGVFLLLHLWTAAALLSSHTAYDRQVSFLHGGPILGFLEVVLVLVPLLFHAGFGMWLSFVRPRQPRPAKHGYDSPLMLSLERVSGAVVLVFVLWHLWQTRLQTWTGHLLVGSYSTKLVEQLSSLQGGIPWVALGYLLGIAATLFHLVNGMTSFCATWGVAKTPAALHRTRLLVRGAGILCFAIGAATVIELATGARFFAAEQPTKAGLCGPAAASPNALPGARP